MAAYLSGGLAAACAPKLSTRNRVGFRSGTESLSPDHRLTSRSDNAADAAEELQQRTPRLIESHGHRFNLCALAGAQGGAIRRQEAEARDGGRPKPKVVRRPKWQGEVSSSNS
jgi:hypothetical protein